MILGRARVSARWKRASVHKIVNDNLEGEEIMSTQPDGHCLRCGTYTRSIFFETEGICQECKRKERESASRPFFYLIIKTDSDFGVKIEDEVYYGHEIRIKSYSKSKLQSLAGQMFIYPVNIGMAKSGRKVLEDIQTYVSSWIYHTEAGNRGFEFGESIEPEWDLVLEEDI